MTSIPAQEVAKEVIKTLGNSRRPVLRKIAREKGYSEHTADTPKNITDTKSYKDIIKPVIDRYEKLRDRIIDEMNRKGRKLSKEKLIALTTALKNTTHDIQLLTGGKT